MPGTRAALLLAVAMAPVAAAAQDDGMPLSAIEWLSESVATEPGTPVAPPIELYARLPADVSVVALDAELPDEVGLHPGTDLGLRADLWGRSSARDLSEVLARLPSSGPPSLRRFAVDLLTARLDAPVDAAADESFFLARVDKLLDFGRLEEAKLLLDLAGVSEPNRFRRWFDIALLTGTEGAACARMEVTPELSPTYPARIFCLARNGEWDVAALTLGNAEALGILSEQEDALFEHFLDPVMFEDEPVPPFTAPATPLLFSLYEAIGERPQTTTLPTAFAAADLTDRVGWQTRLRAGERLASAGAMSGGALVALMREHGPAASGGIWDRAAALSALADEIEAGGITGATLAEAWVAAREGGYRAAIAPWLVPHLGDLTPGGRGDRAAFEAGVLVDDATLAARFAKGEGDDLVLAVLRGTPDGARPKGMIERAVVSGLSPGPLAESDALLIEDGRAGEALLGAMARLSDGIEADPAVIQRSLKVMRHLGAADAARRIAAELLMQDGEA